MENEQKTMTKERFEELIKELSTSEHDQDVPAFGLFIDRSDRVNTTLFAGLTHMMHFAEALKVVIREKVG